MKLPRRTRSSGWIATVSAYGTVWCSLRGESNVEGCVGCPHLDSAERRGDVMTIQCRPPRRGVTIGELLASASI